MFPLIAGTITTMGGTYLRERERQSFALSDHCMDVQYGGALLAVAAPAPTPFRLDSPPLYTRTALYARTGRRVDGRFEARRGLFAARRAGGAAQTPKEPDSDPKWYNLAPPRAVSGGHYDTYKLLICNKLVHIATGTVAIP